MIQGFRIATFIAALACPAFAGPPALELPIDCTLGQTCYIEDYVDRDPGPGQADYTCGLKSRPDHRGTDFVLDDFDRMAAGVNVLAAAGGTVAAIRDGVPDQPVTDENRARIEGRECGNAVRIDHGGGWQTLYCHMAKGSLRVAPGDEVEKGQVLGQVGLSGLTNVPHVHLGVFKDGQVIDPFAPDPETTCAKSADNGLWRQAPKYDAAGLFTAGFSTAIPSFDEIETGAARKPSGHPGDAIVLYAHAFHAQPGDRLVFTASGPDGEVFNHSLILEAPKPNLFRAFGRRSPENGWPAGVYRGYVSLRRDGQLLAVRHADFTVTP